MATDTALSTGKELTITRVLNAPVELVWKVWTDPDHIKNWWGPNGFTNTIFEMDMRPGGNWEFIMHGPEEVDLVHSGLEETMITATREIMDAWKSNPQIPDMRTAAYVVAINKVGTSYAELGIFP